MKKLTLLLSIALLGGCTTTADWGKYRGVPHSHEPINNSRVIEGLLSSEEESRLKDEAKRLGLRYVDYLHGINSNKIRRNRAFFYQAYDEHWDDPSINPVFETETEAKEYAKSQYPFHSYIVREVNYRYEVRQVNDAVNDLLHTSLLLKDSEDYINEYKANHHDLFIYDLKTGSIVGTNTP